MDLQLLLLMLTYLQAPFALDWSSFIYFIVFSAISTPPNFFWQSYLESSYPSHTVSSSPQAIKAAAKNNEKEFDREIKEHKIVETKLNKKNTVIKQALDMTLGALVNTVRISEICHSK